MSVTAATSTTATEAPGSGEQSATPAPEGGKLITHDVMKRHLEKRGHKVEEQPAAAKSPRARRAAQASAAQAPSTPPRGPDGKFESKADPAADEPKEDPTGQADEPKADEKQEAKPDPKAEKAIAELEQRVAHYESREREWSDVVDRVVAQRDHYKALAEQVERALPEHGLELDPQMRENLTLKQQLAEMKAAQERARIEAQRAQQMEQQRAYQTYKAQEQERIGALVKQYPELNGPEARSLWTYVASQLSSDPSFSTERILETAREWVKAQRTMRAPARPAAEPAPRTLSGSRTPRAPIPSDASSWSDVRSWARARFGG